MKFVERICLDCDHRDAVMNFGFYKEFINCPRCNGKFVDRYRVLKYKMPDWIPPQVPKTVKVSDKASYMRNKILEGIGLSKDEQNALLKIEPNEMNLLAEFATKFEDKKQMERATDLLARASSSGINPDEPLLQIELENEASVPKVFYKGEEIKAKVEINFDWKTKGNHPKTGGLNFNIEHFDKETGTLCIIGRKRGEFI